MGKIGATMIDLRERNLYDIQLNRTRNPFFLQVTNSRGLEIGQTMRNYILYSIAFNLEPNLCIYPLTKLVKERGNPYMWKRANGYSRRYQDQYLRGR